MRHIVKALYSPKFPYNIIYIKNVSFCKFTMIDSAWLYMITWTQKMMLYLSIHSALLLLMLLLFITMVRSELEALQNKKHGMNIYICYICIWSKC